MIRPEKNETLRLRDFATQCLTRHGVLTAAEGESVRAGLGEMQNFRAGSELVADGAPLDQPRLLLDGWAVRQRVLSDGRRQIFGFVVPGDAIGLCARRGGVAVCATVALTQVTVAPLPALGAALNQERPTPLGQMARELLVQEESFLYDQITRLGRQSAHERLLSLLLELHARLKQVHLAQDGAFNLPLTQEVLSDALGLSVVHTNRTLQQLKREHLIASKGSVVSLGDPLLLARIADYRPMAGTAAEMA